MSGYVAAGRLIASIGWEKGVEGLRRRSLAWRLKLSTKRGMRYRGGLEGEAIRVSLFKVSWYSAFSYTQSD